MLSAIAILVAGALLFAHALSAGGPVHAVSVGASLHAVAVGPHVHPAPGGPDAHAAPVRPANIVFVLTDDMRPDEMTMTANLKPDGGFDWVRDHGVRFSKYISTRCWERTGSPTSLPST